MTESAPHITIVPGKPGIADYCKQVVRHHALIRTFVMREIKVKYAQTYLGIMWSIIQALVGLVIITLFFGYLMNIDTGAVPYPVFAFPGMMGWYYFSLVVAYSGSSLVQSQHLVQKVNFPKIVLPVAYAVSGLFEFVVWTALMLMLLLAFGQAITLKILLIPVFMGLLLITGLCISIWLAALTIRYRDLLIIIPYIIGFGIFVTPVFFPGTMVPEDFEWLLFINPMAGIIEGLRWCFLDMAAPDWQYGAGLLPVIVLLLTGINHFRAVEVRIPDEL
jgi:lipopolysaccharide transport system permease protein